MGYKSLGLGLVCSRLLSSFELFLLSILGSLATGLLGMSPDLEYLHYGQGLTYLFFRIYLDTYIVQHGASIDFDGEYAPGPGVNDISARDLRKEVPKR